MSNCGYSASTVYKCPHCGSVWCQHDMDRYVKCEKCKKYGYDKYKKEIKA